MSTATDASTQQLQLRADDAILLLTRLKEPSLRDLLRNSLRKAVVDATPLLSREAVVHALSSCGGTALAPFTIDDEYKELLIDAVQLCISQKHEQSRFRITSTETIGTDGGLVLLSSGKTYYTPPQYEHAKQGTTTWFIATHELPPTSRLVGIQRAMEATIQWDGEGYAIHLDQAVVKQTVGVLTAERLSEYQKQSYASIRQSRFDQIGLRLTETDKGGLAITTGSSEATMRFSALCSKQALLVLVEPENDEGTARRLVIPLPDLDDIPAKTPLMYTRPTQDWAHIPAEITVDVSQEQLQLIGNAVGWPDRFLTI
jgi:hypothetical protein